MKPNEFDLIISDLLITNRDNLIKEYAKARDASFIIDYCVMETPNNHLKWGKKAFEKTLGFPLNVTVDQVYSVFEKINKLSA